MGDIWGRKEEEKGKKPVTRKTWKERETRRWKYENNRIEKSVVHGRRGIKES